MTHHRITAQGRPWTVQPRPDRNRTRHDGAKLVTDEPMTKPEKVFWCSALVSLTSYAVAVMMGWLPNPIGWVL